LHVTNKQSTGTDTLRAVRIVPYRTVANGSTLYRVYNRTDNLPAGLVNNPGSGNPTGSWTDTKSDASINTHAILYTTGGRLGAQCPPSAKMAFEHKGRLVLVGCEDPYQVWLSMPLEDLIAPEF
jgi:hypothetical protein